MTREMPATTGIGVQIGTGGGTRTPDTQFRKLVLYPLSYARSTSHGTIRPAIKGMTACQWTQNPLATNPSSGGQYRGSHLVHRRSD